MRTGSKTMRISYYPDVDLRDAVRPVVTMGNFDGVHLGHQRAITLLLSRARELEVPAVALTFEPHPVSVLRPQNAPKRILTPKLKQEVLGSLGLDELVIIHFTEEFSRITADEFVASVLAAKLHVSELVLGGNFRFGHGREGDVDSLRKRGESYGFVVHEVPASEYEGEIISSSRIRKCLDEGAVDVAARMLGRPYFFEGEVVRGDGRGRLMGFPTANIKVKGDVLVGDGVYVTDAVLGSERFHGMTHVGRRPTFGLEERMVETHLFDFDRSVYGSPIRLYFHKRVRGTVRFSSAEALERQLRKDREEAQSFFRGPGRNLVL